MYKLEYNSEKLYRIASIFCITYFVFSIIGAIYHSYVFVVISFLMKHTTLGLGKLAVKDIFLNNLFLITLLMGVFSCDKNERFRNILASLYSIYIGAFTGFVTGALVNKLGTTLVITAMLPHGIIELTTIFLSISVGFKLSEIINWKERINQFIKSLFVLGIFILISAFIEVYISGKF